MHTHLYGQKKNRVTLVFKLFKPKNIFLFFGLFFFIKSSSATILITGGTGYIGSCVTSCLYNKGYKVIVLDRSISNTDVKNYAQIIKGDYGNEALLSEIFRNNNIDAVIHLAGIYGVDKSSKDPILFYENNVSKTLVLLKAMIAHNIKKFIFSSSAAVYGNPIKSLLAESDLGEPINPYGKSKKIIEDILHECDSAYNLKFISLRYFNVAGFTQDQLKYKFNNSTQLISLLIKSAESGREFNIYGDDFPTLDGTCVRDYVHVSDIGDAHCLALEYLNKNKSSQIFNLGSGTGYSIKQVIQAVEKITGNKIHVNICPSRSVDPCILVADINKAKSLLSWKPEYSVLDKIIKSYLKTGE